jgi:xanthine dehydrogenase accessory factor
MNDLLVEAAVLKERGETFALATVVRCQRPASARPGMKALIHADGRMEGWIGGSCARPVVIREALQAIRLGTPRLVRLRGRGGPSNQDDENLVEYPMTCHSGGTLEIYLEPHLPAPVLVVVGESPAARALARLGQFMGYEVTAVAPEATLEDLPGARRVVCRLAEVQTELDERTYLVVAGAGDEDELVLEQAARADLAYLALIASPRRAGVLREYLRERGLPPERVERIRAPAGLDLGAVEPEEIALSIMAEMLQRRRQQRSAEPREPEPDAQPETAIDPICRMTVEIATARQVAEVDGKQVYFCCPACKRTYLEQVATRSA